MLNTMIAMPPPTKPIPVIVPSSCFVKPNCVPQSPRMAPRTAKPKPAAISVKKLAINSARLLFMRKASLASEGSG